jgi:protocatechuate 3,4-dioxygenase beta subunit
VSQRYLIVLVIIVLAMVLGVAFMLFGWLRISGPVPSGMLSAPGPSAVHRAEAIPAPALEGAPTSASPSKPAEEKVEPASESSRASLAISESDLELQSALWVEGRVVLPDGTPGDEHVEILADGSHFTHRPLYRAPIGADGSFRIAFAPQTYMGVVTLKARYLYLENGPVIEPTHPPKKLALSPSLGGYLHGRLILVGSASASRDALVGSKIRIEGIPEASTGLPPSQLERSAKLTDDLQFEFAGVPPGVLSSFTLDSANELVVAHEGTAIEAGRAAEMTLEVGVGARVSGRVVDRNGEPFADARIEVRSPETRRNLNWGPTRGSHVKSADDGSFTISGIPAGNWKLHAYVDGSDRVDTEIGALANGTTRDGIEIVIDRPLPVSGRVMWPDGTPARGGMVAYTRSMNSPWGAGIADETTQCDSDGEFNIAGAGDQPIELTASARPRSAGAYSRSLRSSPPTDLPGTWIAHIERVEPGTKGLILTLHPSAILLCRVVDETGARVGCTNVWALPVREHGNRLGRMNRGSANLTSTGEYELSGLQEGQWDVMANAPGYPTSAPVRVTIPGQRDRIDLVIPKPASVSGVVVDEHGQPVASASVVWGIRVSGNATEQSFRVSFEGSIVETSSDDEGRFRIEGLQPGTGTVMAHSRDRPAGTIPLELHSGEVVTGLRLVLAAPVDATRIK